MPSYKRLHGAIVIAGLAAPGIAEADVGEIPSTDKSITIDGSMGDEAWVDAARFDVNIETCPGENTGRSM